MYNCGVDMTNKKQIIVGVLCGALILGCGAALFLTKEKKKEEVAVPTVEAENQEQTVAKHSKKQHKPTPIKKEEEPKKADLYSSVPNNMLPLSAIPVVASLPDEIKHMIKELVDNSQGIYFVEKKGDKLNLIVENSEDYSRHDLEFVEINIHSGHKTVTPMGKKTTNAESDDDIWEYDETTKQPIKHTKYSKGGNVEYTEVWNYSDAQPIKYEMKDAEGRVISVKKETMDGETGMRLENLVYDKDGKTKLNVSTTYEGPEVTRFTYFNAEHPDVGAVIMSEYADGVKTKETVYSPDFKLKNTYTAEYKDGERVKVIVLDAEQKEVETLLSE